MKVVAQKVQKIFLKDSPDLKEIESKLNMSDLIYFHEQVSMLERAVVKFYQLFRKSTNALSRISDLRPSYSKSTKLTAWLPDA